MKKIYVVVIKKSDEIVEILKAYLNKEEAEKYCYEHNYVYRNAISVDEYIDNEVELTNDICDSLDNQSDTWVELTDTFIKEDLNGDESVAKEWKYLKELYESVKETFGDEYTFSKYLGYCMNENEWKNGHTKVLLAKFMKVFCESMRKYPIEKIETAVKLYRDTWETSEAVVQEIELIE